MSVEIMAQCWRHAPYEGRKLLVLLVLADHANDQGICWPSVETMRRKARCSERLAREALAEFERDNWLSRQFNEGKTTTYTVTPILGGAETAGVQLAAQTLPRSCPQNHQGTINELPDVVDHVHVGPNPEPTKPRPKRSWEPHPAARQRAESNAHVLDLDIHIDRYIGRCRDRETKPNSDEWLRWFHDDEQKERTKLKAQQASTEPTEDETGTPRSWRSR